MTESMTLRSSTPILKAAGEETYSAYIDYAYSEPDSDE